MSIGARLKEERGRLGLNQTEFAELGGVQISAQTNYENDKRAPDAAYLEAVATAGVDVLYVITGQRGGVTLNPKEAALLDNFRHCPQDEQAAILTTSAAFAQLNKPGRAAKKRAA